MTAIPSHIVTATTPTVAFPVIQIGIQQVIRMPFGAMRGTSISSNETFTPKHVLFASSRFKMGRIYTTPMQAVRATCTGLIATVAEMVKSQTSRDGTYKQFIGETMGKYRPSFIPKLAVPILAYLRKPQPAAIGFLNLLPKPIFKWFAWIYTFGHNKTVPSPTYAPLSHDTQAGERRPYVYYTTPLRSST